MLNIYLNSIFAGLLSVLTGYIVNYIIMKVNKDSKLAKACDECNKLYGTYISLFISGFIANILLRNLEINPTNPISNII